MTARRETGILRLIVYTVNSLSFFDENWIATLTIEEHVMSQQQFASQQQDDKSKTPSPSHANDKDDPHSAPESGDKEPPKETPKH